MEGACPDQPPLPGPLPPASSDSPPAHCRFLWVTRGPVSCHRLDPGRHLQGHPVPLAQARQAGTHGPLSQGAGRGVEEGQPGERVPGGACLAQLPECQRQPLKQQRPQGHRKSLSRDEEERPAFLAPVTYLTTCSAVP